MLLEKMNEKKRVREKKNKPYRATMRPVSLRGVKLTMTMMTTMTMKENLREGKGEGERE